MHNTVGRIPDASPGPDSSVDRPEPSNVHDSFQEGLARYNNGQRDSAKAAFRRVLQLQPDNVNCAVALQHDAAEALFKLEGTCEQMVERYQKDLPPAHFVVRPL